MIKATTVSSPPFFLKENLLIKYVIYYENLINIFPLTILLLFIA